MKGHEMIKGIALLVLACAAAGTYFTITREAPTGSTAMWALGLLAASVLLAFTGLDNIFHPPTGRGK